MTTPAESSVCPQCGTPLPANAPHGLCPACLLAGVDAATDGGDPSLATAAQSEAPPVGQIAAAFPQLEILELIGRGGMSFVYKARQPALDRNVALKLLPQRLAAQPGFRERFTREGRMLARLSHPSIVTVFDFGELGGYFYLLMEFVDGVNLRQAMRAGRFTLAQALEIVPKICEALSYAHGEGVLHRDIKPENILLDTRGRVKIADFGIAKLLGDAPAGERLTAHDAALGTPHYMAPEQIERPSEVDHRADIYSLGVVFYEMLTGELPLGHFAPPSARSPLDPRVDEVVMRALAHERERRQQSAGEVKAQVETIAATPGGGAERAPQTSVARSWSGKAIASAICAVPAWLAGFIGITFLAYLEAGRHHGGPPWPLLAFFIAVGLLPALLAAALGEFALREPAVRDGSRRGAWLAACGWATLPAISAQLFMLLAIAFLPNTAAPLLFLPFPIGLAANVWLAARKHRQTTGRSAHPWPRRFATALAALASIPALVVLPWILSYSPTRPPASAGFSAGESHPAGTVELIAIAPHPSTDHSWWGRDGTVAPERETGFVNSGSRTYPGPDEHAFEFVFRTRDRPGDASSPTFQFDPAASWAGGSAPARLGEPSTPLAGHHLVAATFARSVRSVNIRVGVANGGWETLAACEPRGGLSTSLSHGGTAWSVSFGETVESKGGEIVVHVAHSRPADWETRVVAVNAAGEEIKSDRSSVTNEQTIVRFTRVTLAEVKELRFQARRYHWTEFRDVPLVPVEK